MRVSAHARRRDARTGAWQVNSAPGRADDSGLGRERGWERHVPEWQAACVGSKAMVGWITVARMRRSYCNSEGVTFVRRWTWNNIHVTAPDGRLLAGDGADSVTAVTQRLRSCMNECTDHEFGHRGSAFAGAAPVSDLLLAPTVTGALLHELVGHGAEQGFCGMDAGTRVGPACMRVTARFPWSGARGSGARGVADRDDEGVDANTVVLVKAGRISAMRLADRASARARQCPSGLAVVGIHGERPRLRCVRLCIAGSGERVADAVAGMTRFLRCTGVIGAEFHQGVAFVAMRGGEIWQRGEDTGARVGPFLMRMGLAELAERLVSLPGEPTRAQAVSCVKARDPIPSCNEAPHAVLMGARIMPI